jgi:protein-tyrosine phosphatase
MAAGILQYALQVEPEPLKSLQVISAGVASRGGDMVSPNSVLALKKVGIDISGHRSQPLTQELANGALAVFCMTETHRIMIQCQFDPVPKNIFLLREFLPRNLEVEIPDPFGGPLSLYEQCRDEIVEAVPSVIEYLRGLLAAKKS